MSLILNPYAFGTVDLDLWNRQDLRIRKLSQKPGSPTPTRKDIVARGLEIEPITIDIENLVNRYVSDEGITLGVGVSGWATTTVSGDDFAQLSTPAQLSYNLVDADFNSLPSLEANGTNQFISTPVFSGGILSQPTTVVIVYKIIVKQAYNIIYDSIANPKTNLYNQFSGNFIQNSLFGSSAPDLTPQIAVCINNTSTSLTYVGGGSPVVGPGDAGSNNLSGLRLGSQHTLSVYSNIKWAELRVYTGVKTDEKINTMCNQLATRYALPWADI